MEGGASVLTELTNVVSTLMSSVVNVWSTIVSESSIQPYFLLGIGISLILVAVKVIRKVVWGA